jgi:colanic acid/amylovoran biosynthesis glycosyltransferase
MARIKMSPTVAYIANEFPSAVEWYVPAEIQELRRRGVRVIPCSVWRSDPSLLAPEHRELAKQTLCLEHFNARIFFRMVRVFPATLPRVADLIFRVLCKGNEKPMQRLRGLLHTLIGLYFAALLVGRNIEHIHAHHGYFSAWIAVIAARALGVPYSLTLHGSDLLLHAAYLDTKLGECTYCLTISEFNRRHILAHYPMISPARVFVQHLGVGVPPKNRPVCGVEAISHHPLLLSVGRLHPVKNHLFLVQACYVLRESGIDFHCVIAGEGPERRKLEWLIGELRLWEFVTLAGHLSRAEVDAMYEQADLVVLTSRSEGIPLVLMEAMAHEKIVLAPAITGIPELVTDGKTGFLYEPESLEQFVWRVDQIFRSLNVLDSVKRAARQYVITHFDQQTNLAAFGKFFVDQLVKSERRPIREDPVLQQV